MGIWKSRKWKWKWKSLAQEQSGDWRVSSLVPRPTKPYFVPTLQITKKRPGNEAGELLCDFHGHGSSACRERGYQLGRVTKTSTCISYNISSWSNILSSWSNILWLSTTTDLYREERSQQHVISSRLIWLTSFQYYERFLSFW